MKRLTDAFAVLIAVAGFAVSYTTQVALAGDHGFGTWQAWLWPGIADAAALAMVMRLHFGQVRPGWYTVEAWTVFGLASAVAVGANAIADRSDPLGGLMHGVVPVVVLLVAHVIVHGRPAEVVDTTSDPVPAEDIEEDMSTDRPQRVPAPKPERIPSRARVPARAQIRAMLRRDPALTAERVVARTGLSRKRAVALLREERQPHVVPEEGVR